jgi:hypothetical protein
MRPKKNVVYKMVSSKKLAGWVGGWVGGWMDGRESRVKDCLQQSKMFISFERQRHLSIYN